MGLSLCYGSIKAYLCAPPVSLTWVCSSSPPSVSLLKLTLDPEGCLLLLFGFRWAEASGAFGASPDQLFLSCSLAMCTVSARGPESKASLSWGCGRPREKGGDSAVEHKALLIHLLLQDSCRKGSSLASSSLSKELWHRTSLQGPSIISHCVSVKLWLQPTH